MKPPASRYRVVERGRRLVVIDSKAEKPAGDSTGAASSDSFVTRRWFDARGPRRIRLDYAVRQQIKNLRFFIAIAVAVIVALSFLFWPALPILIGLVVLPEARNQLRRASTAWIDGLDRGNG